MPHPSWAPRWVARFTPPGATRLSAYPVAGDRWFQVTYPSGETALVVPAPRDLRRLKGIGQTAINMGSGCEMDAAAAAELSSLAQALPDHECAEAASAALCVWSQTSSHHRCAPYMGWRPKFGGSPASQATIPDRLTQE